MHRHAGLFLLVFALIAGCRKDAPAEVREGPPAAVLPPVVAPEGLLAEVVAASPDVTWGRLQRGVGGATALFPMTLGGLLCALAGIDPSLGPEIDGASPLYAVIADGAPDPAFAVAVKLVAPARARTVLVDGEGARYAAKEEGGMTKLSPKGEGRGGPPRVAMAIAPGGYFIMADSAANLARLGPYAHRTLPTRPLPASAIAVDVPHQALKGTLRAQLLAGWTEFRAEKERQDAKMRKDHGGRPPDFADPSAILAMVDGLVQSRAAQLADLEHVSVAFDMGDAELKASFTLAPSPGGGPATQLLASMHPGDAQALLDAPADSIFAFVTRGAAAERESGERDAEEAVAKALGDRLPEADRKKLHVAATDWSKGRGDATAAWVLYGRNKGIFLHTQAADAEVASRALREAVDLLGVPAFKAPLKTLLRVQGFTAGTTDVAGLGRASLATAIFDADKRPSPRPSAGIVWGAKGSDVYAAIAEEPALFLAAAAPAEASKPRLGADPAIARAISAIGADASWALVAQPLALERVGTTAPLVFAWGRRDAKLWAHLEVSSLLAREVVKRSGGF